MIVGSGIDIAEVPRIAQALARYGDRFLHRVFTEGEIRYCDSKANRVERYAARFAAKEAGMKALGTDGTTACAGVTSKSRVSPEAGPPLHSTAGGRVCRAPGCGTYCAFASHTASRPSHK